MNKRLFKFLWESIKHFKVLLSINMILILISSIIFCIQPYILKIILDKLSSLSPSSAFEVLVIPILLYLGLEITIELIYSINDFIWLKVKPKLAQDLTLRMMDKMMSHSYQLYQNTLTGNLSNRVKDVISYTPEVLEIITDSFLSTLLTIIASIVTLFYIQKTFGLLLIAWTLIFFLIAIKLSKRISDLSIVSAEKRTKIIGYIVDIIGNISSLMLFAGKKNERKILDKITDSFVKSEQNRDKFIIKAFAVQRVIFITYQAVSIYFLMKGLKRGTNTIGDFGLILNINLNLIHEMWFITEDMGDLSKQIGNIVQGLQIALKPVSIYDKPDATPLKITQGEIKFDKVSFRYKNSPLLFDNLSITIPPKQKVALVGYSGSGKTTFVNLILRFFELEYGEILIDNQNIADKTQESIRNSISLVPQDTTLFHRTIMENIRYGKQKATDEEVIEASKKACAHEFIIKLSEGYNTIVGERGLSLSGGQRQRISISRAILKNVPILILDEATSSVDTLTETSVQKAINEFSKYKTTLIVTHRLNTVLNVDRILVFEKGEIIQDGIHKELIKKEGLYKNLWENQIDGFLPEKVDQKLVNE